MCALLTSAASHFQLWLDVRRGGSTDMASGLFDRLLVADSQASPATEPRPPTVRLTAEGRLMENDRCAGACCRIDSPEEQNAALALVGSVEWLLVEGSRAPMITAENLLGAAEATPTRIAVAIHSAADVGGLAFALERGVDALVCDALLLEGRGGGAITEALQICKAQRLERGSSSAFPAAQRNEGAGIELRAARIKGVVPGGTADRVALDFTRLMSDDEGCLVGSSAKALALVHAETVESGFVPPRPFRVNAGPVHSYVLMADESSKYLSELKAGDTVLGVSRDGSTRPAVVGRCKVEPRPVVRVDFELSEASETAHVFLQQAETVRLATPVGCAALPVTAAARDGAILVRTTTAGTHVGKAIGARVVEH
ncbi:hypothetical protein AB1Y20_000043 [Prymnesium parvum]|uniref:3-dehydroquinate synthase n=1 Tax=Prymnesium parvum TaxID=97485 RepID=A0AB34J1E6_PRYPA